MEKTMLSKGNIRLAVPFFLVKDMITSLHFYMEGLGFEMINQWIPKGKIEWCYLRRGGAALMLQELSPSSALLNDKVTKGSGVSICFMCTDALELYAEFLSRDLKVREPFVGNGMWVTGLSDPDGYRLDFESDTDVPEETRFADWKK
jgi:lactoylglutathione lyase